MAKSPPSHHHHLDQVFQNLHSLAHLSNVLFQRYSLEGVFQLPLSAFTCGTQPIIFLSLLAQAF